MSGARDYIDREMDGIPGWFSAIDALMVTGIAEWQQEDGFAGDLLEIGVYKGRSAVLLGHLVGRDERLVLCDLFEDLTEYEGLTLDGFLATYARHHARPPIVYQCLSNRLGELETTRVFRMIHIDGSHAYDNVRSDIGLVPRLLLDGGTVILDDYRTLHTPGVSGAVWEAVATGDLRPICLTHDKMYASWGRERAGTRDRLRRILADVPWVESIDDTVCGHEVVVVLPSGYRGGATDGSEPPPRSLLRSAAARLRRRVDTRGGAS